MSADTRTDQVPSQTSEDGPPTSPTDLGPPGLKVSLQRAVKEFKVDRGSLVSAGMAFYWFLAVFPAIIAAVGVLGLTNIGNETVDNINKAIGTTLPGSAAKTLQDIVTNTAKAKGGSGSLLATIFGLALAVWGASAGMVALQRGLDVAYDVEEERKLVSARARAMLLILLTVVMGGVATVLIVFGAPLGHGIEGHLPFGSAAFNIAWTIARWVLGLAALSILFAGYYSLGPNRESPRWTWVSPGGIVATVVWLLASLAFSFYVTSVGDLVSKYGSLSGVVALMLWLYLSALAVILGAELNAELERQGDIERRERGGGRRRRPARRRSAGTEAPARRRSTDDDSPSVNAAPAPAAVAPPAATTALAPTAAVADRRSSPPPPSPPPPARPPDAGEPPGPGWASQSAQAAWLAYRGSSDGDEGSSSS